MKGAASFLPDRRAMLAGLGCAVLAAPVIFPSAYAAGDDGAGPFAGQDRRILRRRLETYFALVDRADPRQLDYHVPALRSSVVLDKAGAGRIELRAVALNDAGDALAVELLRPETGGRQSFVRFFHIDRGFIAGIMDVDRSIRFLPADDGSLPPRPEALAGAAPDTMRLRSMTEAKYRDYLTLFSHFDPRFVEYCTPDIIFAAAPAQRPLKGRQALLSLYRPLRAALDENITLHRLAIDNRSGVMIVALTNRLLAHHSVALPGRTLQRGDRLQLTGAMIYGLRDGRISLIRDVGG